VSLTRRALLGLVAGLPFALKAGAKENFMGIDGINAFHERLYAFHERLYHGQWGGLRRVHNGDEPGDLTYQGVPVLYEEAIDVWPS
jgi:hypothetical protein